MIRSTWSITILNGACPCMTTGKSTNSSYLNRFRRDSRGKPCCTNARIFAARSQDSIHERLRVSMLETPYVSCTIRASSAIEKIEAAINNAKRFIEVRKEYGTFSNYMWSWVGGNRSSTCCTRSRIIRRISMKPLPVKGFEERGFSFLTDRRIRTHASRWDGERPYDHLFSTQNSSTRMLKEPLKFRNL